MFKCTCVICEKIFEIDQPYDVCSIKCEAARWSLDEKRPVSERGYVSKRDDKKVKPTAI